MKETSPFSKLSLAQWVSSLLKKRKDFPHFVVISFVSHLLIILLLLFLSNPVSVSTREINPEDTQAFLKALEELKEEFFPAQTAETKEKSEPLSHEKLLEKLEGLVIPDWKLNEKQKIEFYKKLIKASMEPGDPKSMASSPELPPENQTTPFQQKGSIRLDSGGKIYPSKIHPGHQKNLFFLPQQKIEKIRRYRRFEDVEKKHKQTSRGQVKVETEKGIKFVPEPYYFRESPYEKLLAQGTQLFFITRGFPALGKNKSSSEKETSPKTKSPFKGISSDFRVVYLRDSAPSPPPSESRPWKEKKVLKLSEEKRNTLLDEWMELKEEEQFYYFKENYLEKYHPDKGDLASLTREFIYNNQSNVLIVIDEISGAFSYLEELYFNKPLDTYLPQFWKQYPKTQTGVECLFCLASFYDFERRGLAYLFDAHKKTKKILSKKYYKINVFNKKAKSYVVKEIYEELIPVLMRKGYETEQDILEKYVKEEEKIYQIILETGGENRDRALYSWGRLHWDLGDYEEALKKWNQIQETFSSEIYNGIREVLESSKEKKDIISWVNDLFIKRANRSNDKLLKRLLHYKRWEKRVSRD